MVPLYNEEPNVEPLIRRVRTVMEETDYRWELILVDDGSDDDTVSVARDLAGEDEEARVTVMELARNYGQTAAMRAGFDQASGTTVVSLDGDLQNDPADIPVLLDKVEEGWDLVSGYRVNRKDPALSRKLPSWIANRIIGWVTGVPVRDLGCSLKAYRKEVLDKLPLYSEMHRFIPPLAVATSSARLAEVPVRHHPRQRGQSKYGLSRVWRVLADLVTVKMIRSFRDRPLLMFALVGCVAVGLGALSSAATVWVQVADFRLASERSFVFGSISLLWFGLGFYLFMLGLIGEVVVRRTRDVSPAGQPLVEEVEVP